MQETMSGASAAAERNFLEYTNTHDVRYLSDDVVFRSMNTGEVYSGKAEVGAMLHYFYEVAFKAKAVQSSCVFAGNHAFVEARVQGKHTGEFAGIPATQRDIDVPICVTYRLKNGLVEEAHIYFLADVLMQQIGALGTAGK